MYCTWSNLCIFSDLKKARADLEVMKKQAESTNREYERLAQESQKLQVSLFMIVQLPHLLRGEGLVSLKSQECQWWNSD